MKKLLLIAGLGTFVIMGANAQETPRIPDDDQVTEEKYHYKYKEKDNGYKLETSTTYHGENGYTVVDSEIKHSSKGEPRSTVGSALNTVGHGAKEAGKGVKNAASWTWDKVKHNKLTKNLFNQPEEQREDAMEAEANANPEAEAPTEAAADETGEVLEEGAEKTGEAAEEAGEEIKDSAEETEDAVDNESMDQEEHM